MPIELDRFSPNKQSSIHPSISVKSFCCPHCGAYTHQYWFEAKALCIGDPGLPFIPKMEDVDKWTTDAVVPEHIRAELVANYRKALIGTVFFWDRGRQYHDFHVQNLHLSKCFTCDEIAVWVHERIVHPPRRTGPAPNEDLPESIRSDFEEARSILDLSPRGAAALLRLCVEKLCLHVKAEGATLNDKIADLVKKGLNDKVQKSLDAVRVIGNDAVHPGQMDWKDDRATADSLFRLVNLIAEKMISEPKHIDEVYGSLPAPKLAAIQKRDGLE